MSNKLAAKPKGRPVSGRGEYYRKYVNHEKMQRLEIHASKNGKDPKSVIDDVIDEFFASLE